MPISGNGPRRLEELLKQVLKVAKAPEMRLEVSKNLAAEARKQVMDEFRDQRSPYGEKWPKNIRGGQVLADTARLRNSIRPQATQHGFNVHTDVVYAAIHNYGGVIRAHAAKYLVFKVNGQWVSKKEVRIPKRQFFPDARRGLGRIWTAAFERVLKSWLQMKLSKGH